MSLSTQTQKRLPQIKQGLLKGLNYTQIGAKCGVTERTIDRDVKVWVSSGDFEDWIKEEWIRLHQIVVNESPIEAYKNLTKLVGNMLTRKIERKEQLEIREKVEINITELLANYEPALTRARESNIRQNNPAEQVDSSQANSETS